MRARPIHDQYARLPWLIVTMTVVVLTIGVLAGWHVEQDLVASALIRSTPWTLAAAWALVWLAMLVFSIWSAMRLRAEWSRAQETQTRATETESEYRQLVEQASDIIYRVDLHGYFTYINSTVTRFKGYTQEELIGQHFTEHIRPDAREAARRFYLRQFARRMPSTYYEFPVIKKDGGEIWFGQNVQLLMENDQVTGFQAVARDITERKKAEEGLKESENRFRTIFDQAPLGIALIDSTSGRFRRVNREYCNITGYPNEDMLALTFMDITHPDDLQADLVNMKSLMEGQVHTFKMEKRYIRKDGSVVWVNLTCVPLWHEHETERRSHIAMVEDITDRKRAEEALRGTTEYLQALIQTSPLAIITLDSDSNVTSWNRAAEDMLGWMESEVLGRPLPYVPAGKEEESDQVWEEAMQSPGLNGVEVRRLKKDGTPIDLALWSRTFRDAQGRPISSVGILADITERKRTEEALRASEERFQAFMTNSPAVAFMKDRAGRYVYVNKTYERLFHTLSSEVIGKTDYDWLPAPLAEQLCENDQKVFAFGQPLEVVETVPTPDGLSEKWLVLKFPLHDASGQDLIGGVAVDVTVHKRMEEALAASEKRLRTILQAEPECVTVTTENGILLDMNAAGLAMIEADSLEQVPGQSILPIIMPEYRDQFALFNRQVHQGQPGAMQFEITGLKGTRRWMDTKAVPLRNEQNAITGVLSISRDITERKQAGERLAKIN